MSKKEISVNQFVDVISEEYDYLKKGTSYRQETAKLALHIALQTTIVEPFLDRETSERIVKKKLQETQHDKYRVEDVAKMLRIGAKKIRTEQIETPEMMAYVLEILGKESVKQEKSIEIK